MSTAAVQTTEERASVAALEALLGQMPQIDLQTKNVLHGGMCARTIFVPAGACLTGAMMNVDNVCIVSGDITVLTDEGPQRLQGFNVIASPAHFKRAGYAHADTWWTTVVRTDKQTVREVEDEVTDEAHRLQSRALELQRRDQACLSG